MMRLGALFGTIAVASGCGKEDGEMVGGGCYVTTTATCRAQSKQVEGEDEAVSEQGRVLSIINNESCQPSIDIIPPQQSIFEILHR